MEGFTPVLSTIGGMLIGLAAIGLLLVRWLFFAEGQHVVNLYHGRQRT